MTEMNQNPISHQDLVMSLPVGVRFRPTNIQLVSRFLMPKVLGLQPQVITIPEVDVYEYDPDILSGAYELNGDDVWYFFTMRKKKHLKGNRVSRVVEKGGHWKPTSVPLLIRRGDKTFGTKRVLDYYDWSGKKTTWKMYEFTLENNNDPRLTNIIKVDSWTLCKIYNLNKKSREDYNEQEDEARNYLDISNNGCTNTISQLAPVMTTNYADVEVNNNAGSMLQHQSTSNNPYSYQ